MSSTRKKQDDKNLIILRELITINGNKYCLDCGQRGPTYVNTTIGSFVCSKCSGMLRGLTPPHRVKSISMATFTPEEIDFIKKRGNDYCRRVWLGLYEGEDFNLKDEQSIKDFMSDKYEKRRYYLEPSVNGIHNGVSEKSVPKSKSVCNKISGVSPLILIAPVSSSVINNHNAVKTVNSFMPIVNKNSVSNNNTVPEFQVDFSTANIYNSSQFNNNLNVSTKSNNINHQVNYNNSLSPPMQQKPPENDRYAALADLDSAFRQQSILKCMDNQINGGEIAGAVKNPFQSVTNGNELKSNGKNPFSNGNIWDSEPSPLFFNPFATTNNSAGYTNSKNPFL